MPFPRLHQNEQGKLGVKMGDAHFVGDGHPLSPLAA